LSYRQPVDEVNGCDCGAEKEAECLVRGSEYEDQPPMPLVTFVG
jgi:hypothetical protein